MPLFAVFLLYLLVASGAWAVENGYSKLSEDSVPVFRGIPFLKSDSLSPNDEGASRDSLKLETSGSKTVQVILGDGGTEVNQELHLSVRGEATKGVYIDALLSDVGREAGEERTATLEEVDEVHFRVETERGFLHLGDMEWRETELGLSGLSRNTLGIAGGLKLGHSEIRGAYGFDELEHVHSTFRGVDGEQKGYLLSSGTSESYLVAVPGSETVFLNGKRLVRNVDYAVNYAGGILDFLGTLIPGSEDEIRVEFDAYNSQGMQILKAADGKYRGKNLWLDVVAFELASDTSRLKRRSLSDEDVETLRKDDGENFERPDSLGPLARPKMFRRVGARMRIQQGNHLYADGEIDYGKADTNMFSPRIGGPSGRAYRWLFSNDSTESQKFVPLRVILRGDYQEDGFRQNDFQGSVRDWDSYSLRELWDLDSASTEGSLRLDEISLRLKLPAKFFLGTEWGYRRSLSAGDGWNSSRFRGFLVHRTADMFGEVSFVRVASFDRFSSERYQGIIRGETRAGFFRPFGNASYSVWLKDSDDLSKRRSEKVNAKNGIELVGANWNTAGSLFGTRVRTGKNFSSLRDSMKQAGVEHSASYGGRTVSLSHILQYKRTDLDTSGASNSWISEESVRFGSSASALSGRAAYRLGLTREVPYVPIYKAVAPGTGDVLFDSLSGVFVEGVDNGNFVYEGMGRSDSADAVRASSAKLSLDVTFLPRMLGFSRGILRDLEFSFSGESEGRDTTGKTLFLPPVLNRSLRKMTSGIFNGELSLLWTEFKNRGSAEYAVGVESEKRNTAGGYFENRSWHRFTGIYTGRKKETWELSPGLEFVDLQTVQEMDWKIYEVTASWKRKLPLHLYVIPKGWLRKGSGAYESGNMDAFLRQASFTLGYDDDRLVRASNEFSATFVSSGNTILPYQMVSGFGKGTTFRNSLSASVDANEYLSLGFYYVIRFGSAESGVFQKMSMEARAYF